MSTFAIAGQLDALAAAFARKLAQEQPEAELIGIGPEAYTHFGIKNWRIGSLLSAREREDCLSGLSRVYYFCLSYPPEGRSSEGRLSDVALLSAYNFAQAAKKQSGVDLILVMRLLPEDSRALGPIYHFWREIQDIFIESCPHLRIFQTAPILHEGDLVARSLYRAAVNGYERGLDPKLLHLCQASHLEHFMTELLAFGEGSQERLYKLVGEYAVSYSALLGELEARASRGQARKFLSKFKGIFSLEDKLLSAVFEESLAFHSIDDKRAQRENCYAMPARMAEYCEELVQSFKADRPERLPSAELKLNFLDKGGRRCYVQRLARGPKRSVSQIVDLFMQWLPRYFQRLLRIESMDEQHSLCRFLRLPLLELEKREESPRRCRLWMANPWASNIARRSSLLFTITGASEAPRELLAIIEDGPDAKLINLCQRAIFIAFARYLREYGVVEALR